MLRYVCDWCKRTKKMNDHWILGFAAESLGATGNDGRSRLLHAGPQPRPVILWRYISVRKNTRTHMFVYSSAPSRQAS